ncbi:putative quinol monooxygenase [Teichococcus wenyumeiae]|uniref:putative quinol monooxygenase n=1 Tax=Teichococcus wenyumeiae TaxID=2478470 RepID=UPI002279198A|nr:putative quinol monooxygenase [Pseudoroseomonas wenyumeiae]
MRALLNGMTAASRAEPGNLRYDLWQDQTDPGRFVLDELYVDGEAVAAHRATPDFQIISRP